MKDRKAAVGRKQSSVFNHHGQEGLLQFLQDATISERRHSTDSEWFSTTTEEENVQTSSQQSMLGTANRFSKLTDGREMSSLHG